MHQYEYFNQGTGKGGIRGIFPPPNPFGGRKQGWKILKMPRSKIPELWTKGTALYSPDMDWTLNPKKGQKGYGKVVEDKVDQMRDHNKKNPLFYFIGMTDLKN